MGSSPLEVPIEPFAEQAAFVHVRQDGVALDAAWLWRLECDIGRCVQDAGGELDGVEATEDEWIAFCYGQCADALVRVLLDDLAGWNLPAGSFVASRAGGFGAAEERHDLGHAGAPPAPGRVVTIRPSHLFAAVALGSGRAAPGGAPPL